MIFLKSIFDKLSKLEDLNYDESFRLFTYFVKGEIPLEQQIEILNKLKVKKETPIEISAAVDALVANAKEFPKVDYDFADIVGTGGDGHDTINISTMSAFVAATMGLKIAKHGNKSVSSKTGSSDLLESFGINLNDSPEKTKQSIDDNNLGFLFAPNYNDGLKYVREARKTMKTRTIFNILGPLINPAKPNIMLLGVYSKELILPLAKTLLKLGIKRAAIVYGSGLDEVAIHDITYVVEVRDNKIFEYQLSPTDFGLDKYPIESIKGGLPVENREITKQILQGNGTDAQNSAITVNVALLMRLFGYENLKENAQKILKVLKSGECYRTLEKLSNL